MVAVLSVKLARFNSNIKPALVNNFKAYKAAPHDAFYVRMHSMRLCNLCVFFCILPQTTTLILFFAIRMVAALSVNLARFNSNIKPALVNDFKT